MSSLPTPMVAFLWEKEILFPCMTLAVLKMPLLEIESVFLRNPTPMNTTNRLSIG